MIDDRVKQKFLKELEKSGNIGVASARAGIDRSTFYRWKKTDEEFRKKSEEAEISGRENNCDIAEHSLMLNVKDRQQRAIEYLLRHNSPRYRQPRLPSLEIFENAFPGEGLIHYRRAMVIKKKYEDMGGIPPLPWGSENNYTELERYENYMKEWYEMVFKKPLTNSTTNKIESSINQDTFIENNKDIKEPLE